jgi:predicted DNA-binding transcriptional regulator YafY
MPPRNDAPLRHVIIDRCLTNPYKPYPTIEDLKREIELELKTSVSTATIQKDIAQMKKGVDDGGYAAPIKFKRSNQGYYYDLEKFPNYTIRSLGLNNKEIELIESLVGILKFFKGIKVNDRYNYAIDKLYSSITIKKTSKEETLINAIQPEETPYIRGMENFETLVISIKKKIPVSFIYYSHHNKLLNSVIVHPYLMKESNNLWYLVGFSEEHNEVRQFGLDCIYDPVLIDKKFKENENSNLRTLFDNKIGLKTIHNKNVETTEEVTLWVSKNVANFVKLMPLHKTQTYEEFGSNGDIIVSLRLVPTCEFLAKVLSYGEHMEILKPKWLRKEVEKILKRTLVKYKKNKT